jgi:pimeloyl-ACP methyl ester carboxylesterase
MMSGYIERRYVRTPSGLIHLREAGEGPVLLLAHANPWTSQLFEPVLPLFAQAGFRAIAFDALGYGLSDWGEGALTIEGQARVMKELAEAVGEKPAAIIGWHQGGVVGLEFCLRYPGLASGLVMDGAGTATDEQAFRMAERVIAVNPVYPFRGNERSWWPDMVYGRLRLFNPHFELTSATWPVFRALMLGSMQNDPRISSTVSPMVPDAVRAKMMKHKSHEADVPYYDWPSRLPQLDLPLLVLSAEDEPLRDAHDNAMAASPAGTEEFVFPGGHPLIGAGRESEYVAPVVRFLRTLAER